MLAFVSPLGHTVTRQSILDHARLVIWTKPMQTSGKATGRFSGDPGWNKQSAVRANKSEKLGFLWLAVRRKPKVLGDSLAGSWIEKGDGGKFHTDDAHQGFANAMLAFSAGKGRAAFAPRRLISKAVSKGTCTIRRLV